jgi:predicted RNA-binding Zn ribbon-like protein
MDAMCVDFINSEFRDFRGRWVRDDLLQPGWLEQFLTRWELRIENPADGATIEELLALRALLRHVIEKLAAGQLADNDLAALNTIMLKAPAARQLAREGRQYRLELLSLKKDWSWVQAEIVASFAELLTGHDPRRLKICQNPHCLGIFYDESKSRTQRYCTPDKCANLMKVRRFRLRHKRSDQEPAG